MNIREIQKERNAQYEERHALAVGRLRGIVSEETVPEQYLPYFQDVAIFLLELENVRRKVENGEWERYSIEEMKSLNEILYSDVLEEHYGRSYANPTYAADKYGLEMGRLLSMLYAEMRSGIPYSFENRMDYLTILYELFIEVYNSFENTEQEKTQGIQEDTSSDVRTVRDILYWYASDYCDVFLTDRIMEQIDPTYSPFAADIIESADLDNDRYLYSFGEFITANELGTARHLRTLPEETLRKMADVYTEGYRIGFINTGKDLSKKSVVNIRYSLGFEKVIRIAIENFRKMGLEPVIYRAASGIITKREHHKIGYYGAVANWQYEYDHRYDSALFMDKAFRDRKLAVLKTAYEQYKTEAGLYAGPAVIETFGEAGFQPVNKPEAWAFTEKQQKLYLEYRNLSMPVVDEYVPGDETSFTLIAFPVPAIGADFEEIFKETIRINTLDYDLYRDMQQKLIDALDQAEYAEIKGRGTNCTDLRVRLHPLKDPKTQTKFENCVADVNIPVGEVFTSPVLEGTEGVLHVSRVYLDELQYQDLELKFANGMVEDYRCSNFAR